MKNSIVIALLAFGLGAPVCLEGFAPQAEAAQTKKKKKTKTKKKSPPPPAAKQGEPAKKEEPKRERSVVKAVDPTEEEKAAEEEKKEAEEDEKLVPEAPPPMTPEQVEEQRVEEAKRKLEAERRMKSRVTPGAPSRWSNRGAMTPVASAVPVTAELPERAIPIETIIATPGQSLLGGGREEILSARLSFGFYHLQTKGQDQVFVQAFEGPSDTATLVPGEDRDIQFLRARATLGYDHIAGSEFALHLDVEYRPNVTGSRFTDYRLNEAYVSYGLTEFRSKDAPWWGLSLGRLAIREAGYAQADGLAARFRVVDWLSLGVFGGVTANPYGYNWNLRSSDSFSIDWYTGGAFVSLQIPELIVNLAGVVTYGNLALNVADFERAYVYLDGAWLILPELNFVVNGWVDLLPGSQIAQNITGSFNWSPLDDVSLALGGGRFTTLVYALSADDQRCEKVEPNKAIECSFVANGSNQIPVGLNNAVISSANAQPIIPYDAVLMTAIYNTVWVRGAYRVLRDLEVSAKFDTVIRDGSANDAKLIAETTGTVKPSPLRLVPGVGVRYRNPQIVDASVDFSYIVDDQSQSDAVVSGMVGRGLFGLYFSWDARYYIGRIDGFDTGGFLSYTFPRDWFPGALSLRGAFRFFREDVDVAVPINGTGPQGPINFERMGPGQVQGWNLITNQDSILGFLGVEWRL